MPRSFVEHASARCSVAGSKLWFNCNPEGPMHWFYREWILRAEERGALYRTLRWRITLAFTAHPLTLRKGVQRDLLPAVILGEWTAAKGLIYDFFSPQEYCVRAPEKPWERVRISVDYGTLNPTSFGLWALRDGVWYRVREYYYDSRKEGRQKTDAEYVEDLRKFAAGGECGAGDRRPVGGKFYRSAAAGGLSREQGGQRCAGRHPRDGKSLEAAEDRDLRRLRELS